MTSSVNTDLTKLAYSGNVLPPEERAVRSRRWGWWYFTEHQLLNVRRYGWPILMYDVGQPLAYLLAMGLGLGAVVDANSGSIDGVPYLAFVGPALLVSMAMMTGVVEMTFPVMQGFKWQRVYWGASATPIPGQQIAVGHLVQVVLRLTFQSSMFCLILWLFGALRSPWAWLVIPVGVLCGVATGALIQAYSATLEDEGFQFSFIQRFIVMPMFLLSGTFFELSTIPVYLQWIGWISPVWHGADLARLFTYGREVEPWLACVHVGYLVLLAAIGILAARRTYARRLAS